MTKIDIISGFLGAGKTTLIKKLLDESFKGEKIVLIENEFGEIGIDGGFLKDAGVEITEMNSGCICCSLVGDFGAALKQVLSDYAPARIVIEPSGVGKLSDVVAAVERVQAEAPDLHLNSFVTVVDAGKAKVYMKNFGEFFNDQVEHACAIILSRTQKIDQHKLDGAVTLLREKNPKAAILTTPWDQLTGAQILSAMEGGHDLAHELMEEIEHEDHDPSHHHHHHDHEHHHDHGGECGCHGHDHDHHGHHHADEVFSSWGRETVKPFAQDQLEHILTELDLGECGAILRAKGIVPSEGGSWLHFDYVPEEHQVRTGPADYTGRLCVIGAKLDEDGLAALFGL